MSENKTKQIVSKDKLLEAGTYFGHNKSKWNPKMKPYILATKKGTHIIDIQKTSRALEFAYSTITRFAERGASFMFVGTRRQAKETIKENALRTNSYYVSERWLGGTLTNNRTIFARVRRMFDLERLQEKNFEGYTKKEGVLFTKELEKLQKNLSGVKNMRNKPSVMIVADPKTDEIAVKEAKKLGIRVVGIVDTNVDPSLVDIAIPANDDSIKSVTLIITILADAIAAAKEGEQKFAFQPDSAIELPEDLKPERKPKRRFGDRREGPSKFRRESNIKREKKPEIKKTHTTKRVSNVETPAVKETTIKVEKTDVKENDLSELKVAELRELAKKRELNGYSTMKKAELIEALS